MQAVLLAAGKGARLRPLTYTTPKPLLTIGGTTLLEHILSSLPPEIDEIFLVVNHLRDQIIDAIGSSYREIPVHYVVQDPLTGTAGALALLESQLHDRFFVINTDNLYDPASLLALTQHEQSLLVMPTNEALPNSAIDEEGWYGGIQACESGPCLIVCGAYVLNRSFFSLPLVKIQVGAYTEFGLPHTLAQTHHQLKLVSTAFWQSIGTPEEFAQAKEVWITHQK